MNDDFGPSNEVEPPEHKTIHVLSSNKTLEIDVDHFHTIDVGDPMDDARSKPILIGRDESDNKLLEGSVDDHDSFVTEYMLAKSVELYPIRAIKGNVAIKTDKVESKELTSGTKAAEFTMKKSSDKSNVRVVGYGKRMVEEMTDLGKGDFIKIVGHQETRTWEDKESGEGKSMDVFYADKVDVLSRAQDNQKESDKSNGMGMEGNE